MLAYVTGRVPLSESSVVVAHANVVSCDLVGTSALLEMGSGTYYALNGIASRIWKIIQKPVIVSDICTTVVETYDVDRVRCQHDLMALLRKLDDAGLIEIVDAASRQDPGVELGR